MSETITVRRTYKYRLYRCDKKDRKLHHKIDMAGDVWNHVLALQRRYYRLTGKYIPLKDMNNHVLKLRNTQRFVHWQELYSQACQNVCWRLNEAYKKFFARDVKRPPKFRQVRKYKSFTFPQRGYSVEGNRVVIGGVKYRFVKHREMNGKVKTLTVKRDPLGRLWLCFSVIEQVSIKQTSTGESGGFDFGLKTFLVDDAGRSYASPQVYAAQLHRVQKLNRQFSRKQKGSKAYIRARKALAKAHFDVANKRRDAHYKLAHRLCKEYDTLCFEDLHLAGMKALWGRKVSDLGFAEFMKIVEWVALKRGKTVVKIDRVHPTTKTCSGCGRRHELTLRDRTLNCACGLVIDRDHNAAINIRTAGTSAECQSEHKTQHRLRTRVDGTSPRP